MKTTKECSFISCFAILAVFAKASTVNDIETVVNDPTVPGSCYHRLGCFSVSHPYNNTGGVYPDSAAVVNTRFYLFTRHNPLRGVRIVPWEGQQWGSSAWLRGKSVKIVVHGFIQTSRVSWVKNMTRELLRKKNLNVITVDWGNGAHFPYTKAAANTRIAGAEIASLIQYLNRDFGTRSKQFHLIGHSLGAHVIGCAGDRIPLLGRISGLDPAEPLFQGESPRVRLDPTDAKLVDVIHTDGSEFMTVSGFGMSQAVGDIDFYPNGGEHQPGCGDHVSRFLSIVYNTGMHGAERILGCNHDRSIQLYLESINSECMFRAFPCSSQEQFQSGSCLQCGNRWCPSMGYAANKIKVQGRFYLGTTGSAPYCGYHYNVRIKYGNSMRYTTGNVLVKLIGSNATSDTFNIYSGPRPISAGREYSIVHVSERRLGDVSGIEVTFSHHEGYLSWFTHSSISVGMVMVKSAFERQTVYFCGRERIIRSGSTETFRGPVVHRETCLVSSS